MCFVLELDSHEGIAKKLCPDELLNCLRKSLGRRREKKICYTMWGRLGIGCQCLKHCGACDGH